MSIAFVSETHQDGTGIVNAVGMIITITLNAGETIVIGVGSDTGGFSVSSIVDSGGNTYTKKINTVNGGNAYTEVWTSLNIGSGATTVTIKPTGTSAFNVSISKFTGVNTIGNTGINHAVSTTFTVSLTLQATNNYMVSYFCCTGDMGTISSEVGTSMEKNYASLSGAQRGSSYYNTGSAGSLTCSYNGSGGGGQFQSECSVELTLPSSGFFGSPVPTLVASRGNI